MDSWELGITSELESLKSALVPSLVSYFRSTEVGKELEAEYIKQGVIEQATNPLLYVIFGIVLVAIIFPWLRMKK